MSLIFIGYVMYNSKQQAKYQEYMTQVQAEEQARAEAEAAEMAAIEAAQPTDSLSIAQAAEAAKQREISIFGESLLAAKQGVAEQFTMSNDYITADFTTQGGMMKKVVLAEYTKYAPKEERNEQVVLFDPETAMFDMEFYETLEVPTSSEYTRIEGGMAVNVKRMYRIGADGEYEYADAAATTTLSNGKTVLQTVSDYVTDVRTGAAASYIPNQEVWDLATWNADNKDPMGNDSGIRYYFNTVYSSGPAGTGYFLKFYIKNEGSTYKKVRVNIVVAQFQEFYDTYDVKESDRMYIKPEDRLKVY